MHDRYAVDRLLNSINYYVGRNENISQSLLRVKSSLSSAYSSSYTGTLNGNVVSGSYGNTINLNLEIGSVDSEDRVREIIDVIRRELHWNNKTAGRTV